jgi:trehalose 2-sulfotransferase
MLDYYQFSDGYDLHGTPEKVLVVASTGRSGSHHLCSLIEASGQYGTPFEYFHSNNFTYWQQKLRSNSVSETAYKLIKLRTSQQGWFSTKLHFDHLRLFNESMRKFEVKYIFIRRRDTIAQAASMLKASQDQNWIQGSETRLDNPSYRFNYKLMRSFLREIHYDNASWQHYFSVNDLKYHEIVFEDLLLDNDAEIKKINSALDLNLNQDSFGVKRTERQSNEINQKWIDLYKKYDTPSLFECPKRREKFYRKFIRRLPNV